MKTLLLLFCLLSVYHCDAQHAYLHVKKGYKKKKTYVEGDRILLRLKSDTIIGGLITHLRDDTIFILGKPVSVANVEAVIVKKGPRSKFHIPAKQLLLIGGGTALTTLGLTFNDYLSLEKAAFTAGMIGFAPIVVQYITSRIDFSRKEYKMGKKFRLQLIDFHIRRLRPM